ncbi:HAD-like domain-containing protein [Blakeslea trispora]|nr:HAD-like domain-containing protein [Blakeslea trispora]
MEICKHQIQYNGLCAVCGFLLDTRKPIGAYTNMGYDITGLSVTRDEAEKLESENANRLLKARKLSLILDLDQTILHASCDHKENHAQEEADIQFVLPENSNTIYHVKLRPGLEHFLKEVDKLYELHIYTMGTRDYAEAIAKEIDPTGSIFKQRILSRDESGSVTQKKLQRLFPCDISMVVVLDDRSDIWNSASNLVRIKPYEFFTHHSITQTVAEKNDDPDLQTDNELMVVLKVHHTFYSIPSEQADVTRIIPNMKKKVLANVKITFSDKILSTQHKDPTLSWIWQMAISFGATCSTDLTGKTTHLIAINNSKNKVKAAREYGHNIHIVTPAWLLDSTARWQVQPEENYAVTDCSEPTPLDSESVTSEMPTPQEKELENINWDEANREVEDFINESGIDDVWDDTDSDTVDFPLEPHWKRKRESGGESGGDGSEDEENSISGSLLQRRRLRASKRGKSKLFKVTTAPNSRCTSGNTTDNEDSSLDAFVGLLDRELE